jgi:hypothetical protein
MLLVRRTVIGIHDQPPANSALVLSMAVVVLRRQNMSTGNADLPAAPHAAVYAGVGCQIAWRVILVVLVAGALFEVRVVLVPGHLRLLLDEPGLDRRQFLRINRRVRSDRHPAARQRVRRHRKIEAAGLAGLAASRFQRQLIMQSQRYVR